MNYTGLLPGVTRQWPRCNGWRVKVGGSPWFDQAQTVMGCVAVAAGLSSGAFPFNSVTVRLCLHPATVRYPEAEGRGILGGVKRTQPPQIASRRSAQGRNDAHAAGCKQSLTIPNPLPLAGGWAAKSPPSRRWMGSQIPSPCEGEGLGWGSRSRRTAPRNPLRPVPPGGVPLPRHPELVEGPPAARLRPGLSSGPVLSPGASVRTQERRIARRGTAPTPDFPAELASARQHPLSRRRRPEAVEGERVG